MLTFWVQAISFLVGFVLQSLKATFILFGGGATIVLLVRVYGATTWPIANISLAVLRSLFRHGPRLTNILFNGFPSRKIKQSQTVRSRRVTLYSRLVSVRPL